jgi:hypothetical protein
MARDQAHKKAMSRDISRSEVASLEAQIAVQDAEIVRLKKKIADLDLDHETNREEEILDAQTELSTCESEKLHLEERSAQLKLAP